MAIDAERVSATRRRAAVVVGALVDGIVTVIVYSVASLQGRSGRVKGGMDVK